jgi:hypothetical protein
MIRKIATAFALMLLTAFTLPADFSYQQTNTITGGMMASLMKVAGVFSKSATEPVRSTVSVKGDKMMHRTQNEASVIDLGAQTITRIDFQKKTYSVMTFAEMKAAMEQAAQKAQNQKSKQGNTQQMDFKVSVDSTGKTRQIGGVDTKEMLLKMEMQSTDQKSGQSGGMTINCDMWLAPGIAGYQEVRDFYRRMAEKLDWTPSGNMFMANPSVSQGMAGMSKEMAKLDGVPVLQITTMGAAGQPAAGSTQPGAQPQAQQQQQQPPPAERPSLGGVLGGKLGGLGGLGGLGRKKQDQPAPAASEPAPAQASSSPGSLLEMTSELSGFASAALDASQFDVPAGFKKIEADLKK